MGANYVDKYMLTRYREGQAAKDITAFAGDLQAVDEMNALSVELTFSVLTAPWDGYVEKNVVQPGDTLTAIAQMFGTTVAALTERNGLADPSVIYVGQILYYR